MNQGKQPTGAITLPRGGCQKPLIQNHGAPLRRAFLAKEPQKRSHPADFLNARQHLER
jgi:hypothetical protein